jgi:hypothetical protein
LCFLILRSRLGKVGGDGLDRSRGAGDTRLRQQGSASDLGLCRAGSGSGPLRRAQLRSLQTIGFGCTQASSVRLSSTLLGRLTGFLVPGDFVGEHGKAILVAQQLGGW